MRSESHFSMACCSSGVRWCSMGALLMSGHGVGGGICWMDDNSWDSCRAKESKIKRALGWYNSTAETLKSSVFLHVYSIYNKVTLAFWASKVWILRLRLVAAERLSVWYSAICLSSPETSCSICRRMSESTASSLALITFTSSSCLSLIWNNNTFDFSENYFVGKGNYPKYQKVNGIILEWRVITVVTYFLGLSPVNKHRKK